MNDFFITDVTLTTLLRVRAKDAAEFCRITLGMGVHLIEMPPSVYRLVEGDVDAGRVCLKIERLDDFVFFQGRGIRAFSVDGNTDVLDDIQCSCDGGTRLTIIFPEESGTAAGAFCPKKNMQVRLCGFENVMKGNYRAAFSAMTGRFGYTVGIDVGNSKFTATAAIVEFLYYGGQSVCTSFCGLGGHAATEQVLEALNLTSNTSFRLARLPGLRALCEKMTQRLLPGCIPVAGCNLFVYESGIHADGIRKDPATYEPFEPRSVGTERTLVVGKHSGRAAIRQKLFEIGITPDEASLSTLNDMVRTVSERQGRGLSDQEFLQLYESLAGRSCRGEVTIWAMGSFLS